MPNKQDLILRELINLNKDKSGGIGVTGLNEIEKYGRFLSILKYESLEKDIIQRKLEYMRYYFELENEPYFTESNDILISLKKQQIPSYELFIELLYKKLDDMQNKLQVKNYVLYYPININKIKSEITEFCIDGFIINLLNYSEVKSDINNNELNNRFFKLKKINKSRYQYAKVSVWCRNVEYAHQKARKFVELMLFFISYSKTFSLVPVWLIGIPKPLIELKLNYTFVFENNNFSTYYYSENAWDTDIFYDLEDSDISNLNTLISAFNKADKRIQSIIFDSMKQYNIGLNEKDTSKSFLSFWTSLEILTLKNKNLSHFKVKERLKTIIKMNEIHEYQIERLYSLRNKLVHTGDDSNISPFDRNLMKDYVEILFDFFISYFSKYSYSEIDLIYEFLQKDIDFLEKSKGLIDKVIALKSSKK